MQHRLTHLALALLCGAGCDKSTEDVAPAPAEPPTVEDSPSPAAPAPTADPAPPAAPPAALPTLAPVPLERSATALDTPPKLLKAVTTATAGVDTMRALEVRWTVPAWASKGTAMDAVDDDDTRTAWSCEAEACALGTRFEDDTRIHAIRWSGGTRNAATLRLHTDGGYVDVGPLPARRPRWIVFAAPVPTKTLIAEANGSLSLSDIEVYGSGGLAKPPSAFDPTTATVAPDPPWVELAQWRLHAEACLESNATCELRGTAALGTANGRLALIEAIHRTDCTAHAGVYLAFDRHTRRIVKLAGANRIPTEVFVQPGGLGFAMVRSDGQLARIRIDDGRLIEDIIERGPSFGVAPEGRPSNAAAAPEGCEPFPFDGPREAEAGETGDSPAGVRNADDPLRAKLPAGALKALDPGDACIDEVTPGDFGRKGGDDLLVRLNECGTDGYWTVLLVSRAGGRGKRTPYCRPSEGRKDARHLAPDRN